MAEAKFYRCSHCGNIVYMLDEQCGCVPVCCGDPMDLLAAGSTDAAAEKHVPVVSDDGDTVKVHVGEADHPMTEAHYIQWVAVVTDTQVLIKRLSPSDAPEASFVLDGKGGTAYAYCNLHGLWKA